MGKFLILSVADHEEHILNKIMEALADEPEPVSYTHLDVYKRQDNNQVSIRYLSDKSEIEGSTTISPRLEDLYLWLFPQADLSKEGN